MTIYFINNYLSGQNGEYFVESQDIVDSNTHLKCFVGNEQDALLKLKENANNFLEQESYRFSVAKEIVDGNNSIWCAVENIETDEHAGDFFVFNTFTGQHEKVSTKEEAKQKIFDLKQRLLEETLLNQVYIIDELPKPPQLINLEDRYGKVVGSIPLEVM